MLYKILPNLYVDAIEIRRSLYKRLILKLMIPKTHVCDKFLCSSVSSVTQRVWDHHWHLW